MITCRQIINPREKQQLSTAGWLQNPMKNIWKDGMITGPPVKFWTPPYFLAHGMAKDTAVVKSTSIKGKISSFTLW